MNSPLKGSRTTGKSPFGKTENPTPDPQVEQAKLQLTGDEGDRRVDTQKALESKPPKHDPNTIHKTQTISIERNVDKVGTPIIIVSFVNPLEHLPLHLYMTNDFDMEQVKAVGIDPETLEKQKDYPVLWDVEYRWADSWRGQVTQLVSLKVAQPVTPVSDWVKDPEKVEAFKKDARSLVKRGGIGLMAEKYVDTFIFQVFGFQSWDDILKVEHNFLTEMYRLGQAIDTRRKEIMAEEKPTWVKTHGAKYFPDTAGTMGKASIPESEFETVREAFLQHEFQIDSHKLIPVEKTYDDVIGRFNGWFEAVYLNKNWNPDKVKIVIANRIRELGIQKDDPRAKEIFTGFLGSLETDSLNAVKERGVSRDEVLDNFTAYVKTLPHGELEPTQEKEPLVFPTANKRPSENEQVIPLFKQFTTLTGVPVCDIGFEMNRQFPDAAYEGIEHGPMKGGTDLKFDHVRDRFDQVFGVQGFGWKIEPHPILGNVQYQGVEKVSKDNREYTTHVVTMVCHVLKYRVANPDGSITWEETGTFSDADQNEDKGYAYRGAFTSLMKQILRSFGGLNHIYSGEYDHKKAQNNSSAKPKGTQQRSKAS